MAAPLRCFAKITRPAAAWRRWQFARLRPIRVVLALGRHTQVHGQVLPLAAGAREVEEDVAPGHVPVPSAWVVPTNCPFTNHSTVGSSSGCRAGRSVGSRPGKLRRSIAAGARPGYDQRGSAAWNEGRRPGVFGAGERCRRPCSSALDFRVAPTRPRAGSSASRQFTPPDGERDPQ